MTLRKRRIFLILAIAAFLAGSLIVTFYSQGYILDGSWQLSKRGGLYVYIPQTNAKIYVNNKEESTSGFLKSNLFLNRLKQGEYTVLTAKEGYWPWAKTLEVKTGYVTETRSIMLPLDPKGDILIQGKYTDLRSSPTQQIVALKQANRNKTYQIVFFLPNEKRFLTEISEESKDILTFEGDAKNFIWDKNSLVFETEKGAVRAIFDLSQNTVEASLAEKIMDLPSGVDFTKTTNSRDQKIFLNPETNEIFVDWIKYEKQPPYYFCETKSCPLPLRVFQSRIPIRAVDFFPSRKDLIIMAVSNGIYAMEIDGRGGRLFQPIYKGKNPTFAVISGETSICVLDEGSLIKIYLEE